MGKLEVPDAIVEKWGEPAFDFDRCASSILENERLSESHVFVILKHRLLCENLLFLMFLTKAVIERRKVKICKKYVIISNDIRNKI